MGHRSTLCIAFLLLTSVSLFGQEKQEEHPRNVYRNVYKLDFNVYELEGGKRINERSYTLHMVGGRAERMNVGTRVPVANQYIDVGIRIDASLLADDDAGLILALTFRSSGFALPEQGQTSQAGQPILRNLDESVTARVPFGKPTLVCSADDVNSKRRIVVEVTATKVK